MSRRINANDHFILVVIFFVLSVMLTRIYLAATGYPKIGVGGLHIAHVLWGGLLLVAASMIQLLYRSLSLSRISAVLTGVGLGLFIDEIGKFITADNNYFFEPAAVIIYLLFLGFVVVYVRYFRSTPTETDATEIADALELLNGVQDNNLTHRERQELEHSLKYLKASSQPHVRGLARGMQEYYVAHEATLRQDRIERLTVWFQAVSSRLFKIKWVIAAVIIIAVVDFGIGLSRLFFLQNDIPRILDFLYDDTFSAGAALVTVVRSCLQLVAGIGLMLYLRGKERLGYALMLYSLLSVVFVIDTISFYYFQFSAGLDVLLDGVLLVILDSLRRKQQREKVENS